MTENPNLLFHLTRGNPYNDPCGMGIDRQIFGKSIGGRIFRKEVFDNNQTSYHKLSNGSYELFDPVIPSDFIKSQINYRSILITNYDINSCLLDTITCSSVTYDATIGYALTDVDIAIEGIYTTGELGRDIPVKFGKPQNPSIFLDDEYDSTGKLSDLTFKKQLTAFDLPTDIPFDACLKIWVRRKMVVDKTLMPDSSANESFSITVNEFDNDFSTTLTLNWNKLEGRIPLSNWYDFTITPGKGSSVVMREVLPKSLDISDFNIIDIFTTEDKILLFYYVTGISSDSYFLLIIKTNDIINDNKYIQLSLTFDDTGLNSKELLEIKRSHYNPSSFYFFWNKNYTKTTVTDNVGICQSQVYGNSETLDITTVDILNATIWLDDKAFDTLQTGYGLRYITGIDLKHSKVLRSYEKCINLQQIDDLFILFCTNTKNSIINEVGLNANVNELIYVFEKDIINSKKYSGFVNYTDETAEVFSSRFYPRSLPTYLQKTTFNNVKNAESLLLISNPEEINNDVKSDRRVKYLLDGTRYVDMNSVHGREFKIGKNYITYTLPSNNKELNSIFATTSFSVVNDTSIYSSKLDSYATDTTIDAGVETKPLFFTNIIDTFDENASNISIPIEWGDRIYKDQWFKILSTLQDATTGKAVFSLFYNFHRNIWKTLTYDKNGNDIENIYDFLTGQSQIVDSGSVTTTGSSGSPGFGKLYTELSIDDLNYIIEPDTYQPISLKISAMNVSKSTVDGTFLVNFQVFFKSNVTPIIDITTTTTDITNLNYIFLNKDKSLNLKVNYFDAADTKNLAKEYVVKNLHNFLLNKTRTIVGDEIVVNPRIHENQSTFKYYRILTIDGFGYVDPKYENSTEIVLPLLLKGNAYKVEDTDVSPIYRTTIVPFDLSKLNINDKSMRFFYENNSSSPLPFKIGYYDYERDCVSIWINLKDFGTGNKNILMYYGKNDSNETLSVGETYLSLKNNLYPSNYFGGWFFDKLVSDERLSFNTGKIFNDGEPIVYEKHLDDSISLTKINKEYMYGIAKVYKSNKFNIDLDLPAEETLLFDENTKNDFVDFIKATADIYKPSYTEINKIKPSGIEILEAGENYMGQTTNKRVTGLVAMTPNSNVSTFYDRKDDLKFNILTSFNGYSEKIDWVVSKPIDSSVFKSGVLKVSGKVKSETIKFVTPFKDKNYYVFFSNPVNQNLYWNTLCENRFTITASHYLSKEVTWMAFHKDLFGGVFTPNSIFVGSRTLTGYTDNGLGDSPTTENLSTWYNNELLIKPVIGIDPGTMLIDQTDPGYSILLSSNENINTYWSTKSINQFSIKTSSPVACTVHWLVIKNGIEWWKEIV